MYDGIKGINSMVTDKIVSLEQKVTGSEKIFNDVMNELIGETGRPAKNHNED